MTDTIYAVTVPVVSHYNPRTRRGFVALRPTRHLEASFSTPAEAEAHARSCGGTVELMPASDYERVAMGSGILPE